MHRCSVLRVFIPQWSASARGSAGSMKQEASDTAQGPEGVGASNLGPLQIWVFSSELLISNSLKALKFHVELLQLSPNFASSLVPQGVTY